MSIAKLGKRNPKFKGYICQYTKDGKLVAKYESTIQAAKSVGIKHPSNISAVIKGRRPTVGGFVWRLELS